MKYLNKKGLTLIELLIVLAIMLMVMGLGYSLYYFAQKSFSGYEERWITQNEVRRISRYIEDEVQTVFNCEIVSGIPASFDDTYTYIWAENNSIKIRWTDKDGVVHTEQINSEAPISVEFIRGEDDLGNPIRDFLQFKVSGTAVDYTILDGVKLMNFPKAEAIEGAKTGVGIKYRSDSGIIKIPDFEYSTYCIVATASYGSYLNPSVKLLRRFRDQFLHKFEFGRKFIKYYYGHSEPIAKIIARHGFLRWIVRMLLYPIIAIAAMLLNPAFKNIVLITFILYLGMYILIRREYERRKQFYNM